ncbi:ComEC/Rec2 family competence protein [Mycoplasmopsis agalactiae]|uniref:MAG0480 family ComEC-like protein n=1 Tax=Mycoplasmopsis agalactiae TaxID=2110 RepID=UPI001FA4AAC3|nr:ComEC/Rec2 family competence protein [Mycoplasmopsis agalactiae]
MRRYSISKRHWRKNFFKTKESFNLVSLNLLAFILPIFIHLSIFSTETRYVWIVAYVMLAVYINFKNWKCLGTALLAIVFYLCALIPTAFKHLLDDGLYVVQGTIIKSSDNYFIISNSKHNVLVLGGNLTSESKIIQGSLVEVKGNLSKNLSYIKFDKTFMLSNSIKYVVNNPVIKKVSYQTRSLNQLLNAYGADKIYFSRYWSTMVFGIGDSQIANTKARLINVSHLLVISGLHFDLLFYFIALLANKIFRKNKASLYFVITILFCYVTLLNSFVSAIRSLIVLFVKHQKNIGNYSFKYYDGWFIALVVVFSLNFDLVFSLSFILSFCCSFILLTLNNLINIKWKILKALIIFALIYLFNLPIIAKINSSLNLLSFVFSIILVPIFEIYYLMSIIFFWSIEFMNFMYYVLDELLNILINFSLPLTVKAYSSWLLVSINVFTWFIVLSVISVVINNKKIRQLA